MARRAHSAVCPAGRESKGARIAAYRVFKVIVVGRGGEAAPGRGVRRRLVVDPGWRDGAATGLVPLEQRLEAVVEATYMGNTTEKIEDVKAMARIDRVEGSRQACCGFSAASRPIYASE